VHAVVGLVEEGADCESLFVELCVGHDGGLGVEIVGFGCVGEVGASWSFGEVVLKECL
jgi:hypothetical protein